MILTNVTITPILKNSKNVNALMPAKYDEGKYQYLVLNYDKFSQEESPNLI